MNRCLFLVCVALAMQQCWARHIRKLDGEEVKSEIGASTQPWLLPVFPNKVPSKHLPVLLQNSSVESSQHTDKDDRSKLIPKHLWIALRHKDDELSYQMKPLFERNPHWAIHLEGNDEKDAFMNTTFANTSLLWAYHMIHPQCGAAKADLWRYAVLWTYGGAYIDDDSDMKRPLDQMVEPLDEFIITTERNGFNADACYVPQYHLSEVATFAHANAKDTTLDEKGKPKAKSAFLGRIVPNWAMLSAARHPFLKRTLENAVEIIKSHYQMDPMVRHMKTDFRWNLVMCSTGPSLLTASAREVVFENKTHAPYKLASTDFKDYGGKFKAVSTRPRDVKDHYMNMGTRDGKDDKPDAGLLREYAPEEPLTKRQMARLEGLAVQGHNGKLIYVMNLGKKRGLPNFDTFLANNFTMATITVLTDFKIARIPDGDEMPKLTYVWPED